MYQILPTPRLSARIGGIGRVKLNQKINCGNFTPCEAGYAIRTFIDYADRVLGRNFYVTPESGEGIITLEKDETLPKEGYALIASPDGCVKIAAGDRAGLNHGFASLLLSMESGEDGISLPIMHICDEPQGNWRGLMVDLARKWHPVSYLYNVIDLCWLYKINILQLHFTDNESYTLPSDFAPTLPTENRHYTKAEIAAIREYAAHRSVTLVPEVDMPGHCISFTYSTPDLFGRSKCVMCAEEKTFAALESVIDEVLAMFPDSPYLHIGGDEVYYDHWQYCQGCKDYMKEKGIGTYKELYAHYLKRMTDYVLSKGVRPVVWEGFSEEYNHLISKEVIVAEFESYYQLAPQLLDAGFTVLNCSWRPLYVLSPSRFCSPEEILRWNIYTFGNDNPKSPAAEKPIVVPEGSNVTGGQLCVWGDLTIPLPSDLESSREEFGHIRPRLAALAEKTWNLSSDLSEEDFRALYAHTDSVLERMIRR